MGAEVVYATDVSRDYRENAMPVFANISMLVETGMGLQDGF